MKRPIAELLVMTLNPGSEVERGRLEHEAWQILRRKQGYVTHRIYQHVDNPLERLVYSEWESAKAVDGARQYLQTTPLMRRARSMLAASPQRSVLEIIGPITSTKGLDLPDNSIAACAMARMTGPSETWRETEQGLWKTLASQAGHITHVLLRGVDDRLAVGSVSHWKGADSFQAALGHVETTVVTQINDALTAPLDYTLYRIVHD